MQTDIDEFDDWHLCFYLMVADFIAYMLLCTSRTESGYRKYRSGSSGRGWQLQSALHDNGIGMSCITTIYLSVLMYGTPETIQPHRIIVFYSLPKYSLEDAPLQEPRP